MEKKIIPAIIAKNQTELDERLSKVIDFVDVIQLDIMDNNFVPNLSLNFDFKLFNYNCKFEAHLMIDDPERWIDKNIDKIDLVLVHYESTNNHKKIINQVRKKGKKIGFVLNPETPISEIFDIIDEIDQILIMTVNPGFYGSPFLPDMINKISDLRKLRSELNIEVDGGITDKTIGLVDKAGANLFVSGSFIVKSDDVSKAIIKMKRIVGQ